MKIDYREIDGITIVDLNGRIKSNEEYDVFKDAMDGLVDKGSAKIILNFKNVDFMNSRGLGRLILAVKNASNNKGQLTIAELSGELKSLFSYVQLDSKITIFDSEQDALVYFKAL